MASLATEPDKAETPSSPSLSPFVPDAEAPPEPNAHDADVATHVGDSLSPWRRYLFNITVCMAMFTNQVGLGNTLTTVRIIGASFDTTDPGHLSWLIAGYSLTVGTCILVAGRCGDVFGHRRLFIGGMLWYALWSMVAGLAVFAGRHQGPSAGLVLFVFARVFQGMGPAVTLPNGLALLGRAYPPGLHRNMAIAGFGAAAPLGAMAGFVFGGLFAQLVWWPWVYWSQAIGLLALAVLAFWTIPRVDTAPASPSPSLRDMADRLDLAGGVLGISALVLANFAWNQAVVVGWQTPYVGVLLGVGLVLAALFFVVEARWARYPLVPLAAFNVDIGFVAACTATGWGSFGIWVFYLLQVALVDSHVTPLQAAAWILPIIPSGLVSAFLVGRFISRVHPAWIMVIGQVAYTVGSVLAATRPPDTIYWTYFFFSVLIMTVGMDTSFPAAAVLFSQAVAHEYQGMGASLIMTIVNYSISLSLGLAGTVETQVDKGGVDTLVGFRGALYLSVGLAGLGLCLSLVFLLIVHRRNRRKEAVEEGTEDAN
ncbi:multidrug-resistance type transporter aminotriazole resistance [Sporothrix curviconia]|uniref:Multidrug-resistance type transporter aminotriazole resistance n=1 Tax=Sporothrix curviconia TaxID=1260050 RepID=A0ABP0AKX4_9PEZI